METTVAKLVFGMNQSLDGYVNFQALPEPSPTVFRHFIEQAQSQTGSLYGRTLYEIMRYWDEKQDGWSDAEREFAAAWQRGHKWVVSHSLASVGPNASLIKDDLETAVRKLKAEQPGDIEVGGPKLARSLTDLGLIDEYRIYLHPVVVGSGDPFFTAARPPLRLKSSEQIDENVLKLIYVPA